MYGALRAPGLLSLDSNLRRKESARFSRFVFAYPASLLVSERPSFYKPPAPSPRSAFHALRDPVMRLCRAFSPCPAYLLHMKSMSGEVWQTDHVDHHIGRQPTRKLHVPTRPFSSAHLHHALRTRPAVPPPCRRTQRENELCAG